LHINIAFKKRFFHFLQDYIFYNFTNFKITIFTITYVYYIIKYNIEFMMNYNTDCCFLYYYYNSKIQW